MNFQDAFDQLSFPRILQQKGANTRHSGWPMIVLRMHVSIFSNLNFNPKFIFMIKDRKYTLSVDGLLNQFEVPDRKYTQASPL